MALQQLNREILECRKCPLLVEWREKMALEKRRAYRDQVYWGRPVPGFGDPHARVFVVGLLRVRMDPIGPDASLPAMPRATSSIRRYTEPGLLHSQLPSPVTMALLSRIYIRLPSAVAPHRITSPLRKKWRTASRIWSERFK